MIAHITNVHHIFHKDLCHVLLFLKCIQEKYEDLIDV